jgi:glutathione S-transferase
MLTVYGINLSTFTRKVRLALLEKGIEHRLEVAPMGSPKVRALHPLGKIPVIEDQGRAIPDSSVIIAYLERAYPERPLYPSAALPFARALWLEEYADTRLREATLPFFSEQVVKPLFQGRAADAAALAAATGPRDEAFDYLETELPEAGLAVGETLTVADVSIGAQLITYRQGGGEVNARRWPKLARYLQALLARPLWVALVAEEGLALAAARASAEVRRSRNAAPGGAVD